jgi:hypothetical protein
MEIPIKVQTKMRADEQASFSLHAFGSFSGSSFHLFHEGTGESFELHSSGFIKLPPHVTFDGLKLIVDSAFPQESNILAPSFVCANDSFKIQPENFQNGIVYELYADNGLSIIEPGSSLWSGNMKEGDNLFTLVGRSACSSRVLADSILVEKVTPPAPEVMNSLICQGETATFSVKEIQGINFHWYTLSTDTAIHVGTRYETGPLVKSKNYYISAIDSLGCESPRTRVMAEVISYDSVSIEFVGGILTSSYAEGNQWFFNGDKLEGEVGQTLIAIDPGLYGVVVTVGSCQVSAEYTYTVTNVEEQGTDAIVDVYPNPSIDRLYIRFRPEFNVELIDILSSSAVSVRYLCDISSDRGMFGIDTTFLTSGLYIIFLNIQENPFLVKFIKH